MADLNSQPAPSVPPFLGEMPTEVIELICFQFHRPVKWIPWRFPIDGARKALLSLCQTCKRLHEIALPHLYRYVHIEPRETGLVSFTRSLLRNQQLGDFVRQIKIEQHSGLERDQVIESYFASQQADFLAGETKGADDKITGCDQWYTIRTIDLLLSSLRNIEYLALGIKNDYYRNDCFTYIRDKHLDDTDFLHRLKEVMVYNIDESGFKIISTTALFSIAPIQKMRLISCSHLLEFNSFCLPSLLELRLDEPYLDRTELIRLVKSCPNLQLLRYQRAWYSMDGSYPTATCPGGGTGMSLAISHLKKRLWTLSLSFHDRFHPDKTSMASFAEFSKLRNLTIETYGLADRIEDPDWVDNQDVDEHGLSSEEDYWGEDLEMFKDHTLALQPWVHKLQSSLQLLRINHAMNFLKPGFSILAERAKDDLPNLRILVVDRCLRFHDLFRGTNIDYIEPGHPQYYKYKEEV